MQRSLLVAVFFLLSLWALLPGSSYAGSASCVLTVRAYEIGSAELALHKNTCSARAIDRFRAALDGKQKEHFDELVYKAGKEDSASCSQGVCLPCSRLSSDSCERFSEVPHHVSYISLDLIEEGLASHAQKKSFEAPGSARILSSSSDGSDVYAISSVIYAYDSPSVVSSILEAAESLGLSYVSVAQIAAPVKNDLGVMKRSWDVIFNGAKQTDARADWFLGAQKRLYSQLFQNAVDEIDQAVIDTAEQGERLQNLFELSQEKSEQNLNQIHLQGQFQSAVSDEISAQMSETALLLTEMSVADLSSSDLSQSFEGIAQGALPDEHMLQVKTQLKNILQKGTASQVAQKISYYQGKVASSENLARKRQYENALRTLTDYRGLVKGWAALAGLSPEFTLQTDEFSPHGRALRETINETLGVMINSAIDTDKSHAALDLLLRADKSYKDSDKDLAQRLGDRYLNRARSLLDFSSSSSKKERYRHYRLSESASERFGIDDKKEAASYYDYQTFKIANQLAEIPDADLSENASFVLMANMANLSHHGQAEDLRSFNLALDNSYSILDYAGGFGRGFVKGFSDQLSELSSLISHPFDSAEALALALYNYDQTIPIIFGALSEYKADFLAASPTQKAELIGQVSFDIVSSIYGGAYFKGSGRLSQIASKISNSKTGLSELAPKLAGVYNSARQIGFKTGDDIAKHVKVVERWDDSYNVKKIRTADDVNLEMKPNYPEPPYPKGTKVIEFQTTKSEVFHRVHTESNQPGRWVLRKSDIEGLTPMQIKEKFALDSIPTHISEAHVPAGTNMRTGHIGKNTFGGDETAVQYELLDFVEGAFKNMRPL